MMIRMYGQNTEAMIDRQAEIDTMLVLNFNDYFIQLIPLKKLFQLLHEKGCGPELYAIFSNGICYEFIQGEILSMEDVRSERVYPLVVAEMVKMHCNIPSNALSKGEACDNKESGTKSKIWDKINTFNTLVEEILGKNAGLVRRFVKVMN